MVQTRHRSLASAGLYWSGLGLVARCATDWTRGHGLGRAVVWSRLLVGDLLAVAQAHVGIRCRP